jgi:hypothetical protein
MTEPLTSRQRTIVWTVALVCAATRFLAIARSIWDWDEALFSLGMREYDVVLHHPHPPGFPVYIALAKLARFVAPTDFRALQAVNIIAAMLVFPAVFLFARQLRIEFRTSVIAGALFAFFPNVWFFGGGAFSDIPSVVIVLFAVICLLRGADDRNAYWLATLLLALAIGIRPQNLLVGLWPGIYATLRRRPHEVMIALMIGVTVVGIAFGTAIYVTGSYDGYFAVVRQHAEYISAVDSWRSPVRPPMWRLTDRFFVKQYQSPVLSILVTLFVIASIVGSIRERSRAMLFNALTFAPFAIVAWAMLDRYSISRFSIGYQAMFAVLAADGIRRVAKRHDVLVAGAVIGAFVVYTLPDLTSVRNEIAPSVMAARSVPRHLDPNRDQLFVAHSMAPFFELEAPGFPFTKVTDDRAMPLAARPNAWLLAEITKTPANGFVFSRERGHLWNIARRHYFRVKLEPIVRRPEFAAGWYGPESMGTEESRWMSGHSALLLPPARGRTLLRIHVTVPEELVPKHPRITVTLNGRIVEEFQTKDAVVDREFRVTPAPRNLPNLLELSIDHTVRPPDENRELGLRMRYLGWGPK